jgi:hypothetical protein
LRELNTYFDPYSIGVSYLFQLLLVPGAQLVHLVCMLLLQLLDFAEVRLRQALHRCAAIMAQCCHLVDDVLEVSK